MQGFIDPSLPSQGDKMRLRRVVTIISILLLTVSGVYLFTLYGQLKASFGRQDQLIPTRIYSDVTRIAAPEPRKNVEDRLKSLAYNFKIESGNAESISFQLHPIDYPIYLLPPTHPVIDAVDRSVLFHFSGSSPDSPLTSIELGGKEIADLYFEPELVATLAKGSVEGGKKQIREFVRFANIPANIWQAIIAVEDQHFLEHNGLDPRGLARAIWVDLRTRSFAQGGSTITQQLVKNLMARRTKNVFRKLNELFLALLLEASFDKEQILERYLNEVYLGQVGSLEVHGVSEGAKHFFGKDLSSLNLAETALMAGLIRGPGYYSPYRYRERALERMRLVLKKMVETGMIAQGEMSAALAMPIRLAPPQSSANKAPYFSDFVKAELLRQLKGRLTEEETAEAGFRVYTTLDMQANTAAQHAVSKGITELEKKIKMGPESKDHLEGALASVDPTTGFIRALIGGRSYAVSTFNRTLNMKRQVGSTFKPIVYLTAFEKGYDPQGAPYGPGHPIEDAPWTLTYDRGKQTWSPKNYEKESLGWISYRTALAHSVNTAAAKLGFEVGIENIIKTARKLGIESDLPAVPSLSLGVPELSPIELLRVYSTFANHGIQNELSVIRAITQEDGSAYDRFIYHPKQVFEPAQIDLLTEMMTSVFTEGTARYAYQLGFDRPAAGKTGTTSHHRDSWFAGYTPQLATVVWVGMDQAPTGEDDAPNKKKKQKKIELTGATSALPIWVNFMKEALDGDPPLTFRLDPDLVHLSIDRKSGQMAAPGCPTSQTITEIYNRAHEPKTSTCENFWPPSVSKTNAN